MKVLFVLPELYPHPGGGLATYYLQYLPFLREQGVEPKVIVGSAFVQGNEKYKYREISIEYLNPCLFKEYTAKFRKLDLFPELQKHLAAAWALWEQMNGGAEYDIIETTDWGYGYIPWVLEKAIPVITRLHGSCAQIETFDPREGFSFQGDLLRNLEAQTLPLCSRLITYSKNNQTFWEKRLPCEVSYIPPIFEFPEINAPANISIPTGSYSLVVGRIQNWKGAEVLCKALRLLHETYPIYWVGRDTDFRKKGNSFSRYLASQYPDIWGKKIIPIGPKPHPEVLQWMRNARFGIIPSTWDMFNLTVLEWMKLKKPILCSNGAGAWDLIPAPEGGATFGSNSPEQLASLISEYQIQSIDALQLKGEVAFESISRTLDLTRLLSQNIRFYSSLKEQNPYLPLDRLEKDRWDISWLFPSGHESDRNTVMEQWPFRDIINHVFFRAKNRFLRK